MSASHPRHLNLKLHKRKPSQSVLPSTRSALDTPESTPKYQEPPGSYLPLTWALLAAAFSEGRPPRTSSGQDPPKGGTPSSRNLSRSLWRGPSWRTSGLFPGLCQTLPSPAPFPEPPPTPVGSPRRGLGDCPLPHRWPLPSDFPPLRVPRGFPGHGGWAAALTFSSSRVHSREQEAAAARLLCDRSERAVKMDARPRRYHYALGPPPLRTSPALPQSPRKRPFLGGNPSPWQPIIVPGWYHVIARHGPPPSASWPVTW